MSDSPGLVDFAIRILKLKFRRTVINPANQIFFRLVKMTIGLVHAIAQFINYSLPKRQAVQLTLYAPQHCKSACQALSLSGGLFEVLV